MSLTVAFIGLNHLSVSAALALRDSSDQFEIKAWDANGEIRKDLAQKNIFNSIEKNPGSASKDSDLVIMALPVDEINTILPALKPYMDTHGALIHLGAVQLPIFQWVKEIFGNDCRFISMFPAQSAATLTLQSPGVATASGSFFEGGLVYIADAPGIPADMLELAIHLAVILGGQPVITSPDELEGLVMTNMVIPQLVAASLMKSTAGQPGWSEGQHVAGRFLFKMTEPLLEMLENDNFGKSMVSHGENLALMLDKFGKEVDEIRHILAIKDEQQLHTYFQDAIEKRNQWIKSRSQSQISTQMATSIPTKETAVQYVLAGNREK